METYGALLQDARRRLAAAGIEDGWLEAEVLLRQAAGLDRAHLLARLQEPAAAGVSERLAPLLARRLTHEPLAYVTGSREFFGLEMECSPAALIPRPETETLVELALARAGSPGPPPLITDVGTGNGAIAVALAVSLPAARIVAVDVSRAALALALRNADRHGVSRRVGLLQGDLVAPFRAGFHLIVANLPYVPAGEWPSLAPEVRDHEPKAALVAGPSGTEVIERLLVQVAGRLARPGVLLAEIGWDQGERLRNAAREAVPGASIIVHPDLAGRDRVLEVSVGAGGEGGSPPT